MAEAEQNPTPGGRRGTRTRRARVLRAAGLTALALVLAGVGTAGYVYWTWDSNIRSVDIDSQLGSGRPSVPANGSFNVLVLGSDSRSGANGTLAGGTTDGTARSDTAMLVHVNQSHSAATVVSIPRDTLVNRPACTAPGGTRCPRWPVRCTTAPSRPAARPAR